MRAMSGARAREAAPLLYFMLMPHFSQWLSPLHLAADHGRLEIVRLLVSAGANVNMGGG